MAAGTGAGRRWAAAILAAVCWLAPLACSTTEYHADFDPGFDFTPLERFGWWRHGIDVLPDPRIDDESLEEWIQLAIQDALERQGYRLEPGEEPDFRVGFHLVVRDNVNVTDLNDQASYSTGWGRRYGFERGYGWGPDGPGSYTYVRQYTRGALIVDVVDPRSDRLVWRGAARGTIDLDHDPLRREVVEEVVGRVLSVFPPGRPEAD